MQITLIRHGRSGHVQTGFLNHEQVRAWRVAYEGAAIAAGEVPPPNLFTTGLLVASDAPRAISSAQLLAPDCEILTSPLLRELDLHPPNLGRLRLPLLGWGMVVGFRSLRLAPAESARVTAAAHWLAQLAAEHDTVVAVTHASVRRLIGRELQALGWLTDVRRPAWRHWSSWTFTLNAE